MREINLLPRKPFIEKAFWPLLAAIFLLMLAASSLVIYVNMTYDSDLQTLKDEISRMEVYYAELAEARQPDPMLQDYQVYRAAVRALDAGRRDWLPVLDDVTGFMPLESRALSISADDSGTLQLSMEFFAWEDIAAYMMRLRDSERLEAVEIKSIMQVSKELSASESETAEIILPEPEPEFYWPQRQEDYSEAPGSPSNGVLDELVEIITQRAEYQQFGWSPSASSSGGESSSTEREEEDKFSNGPFTPEEVERARQRLEQFKNISEQPVRQPAPVVVPEAPVAVPDAGPEFVQVYVVSLELRAAARLYAKQEAAS